MKIILSPIASSEDTTVSVDGSVITINGIDHDLGVIPVGGQAEATVDSPFFGIMTRDGVTIKYFYDSTKADPKQSTNIADYTFDVVSGEVPNPIIQGGV